MKSVIILVCSLSLFSCKKKNEALFFYVPGKLKIEQQSVVEIGKDYNVNFGQYVGFCFNNSDTIFNKICMVTSSQDFIDADMVSNQKQEQIKKLIVRKLEIQYKLREFDTKDSIFDILKATFSGFEISKTETSIRIADHCGKELALVNYYDSGIPNVLIEIFPVKESCLKK